MRRILLLTLFFSYSAFAQTETNVAALQAFAKEKRAEFLQKKAEAEAYAQNLGLPIRQEFPDGTIIEIRELRNGRPMYFITTNADAAISTRTDKVWPGGGLGFSLTGSGYSSLGEWDGGGIRTTHQEFGGRVTQGDSPSSTSSHSTHVAGTMIAAGVDANAKGMAYEANLTAYDWDFDETEMASEASSGMEMSNHSYGFITGWYQDSGFSWHWYGDVTVDQNESFDFGFYDTQAQNWDQIAYDAPFYLIVKSAGNDRSDTAPSAGTTHSHNGSGSFTDSHNDDGYDNGGFDTIRSAGVSKNVLTIAAVGDVASYSDASSVAITSFSGWGPADDGRIKPDLSANGDGLYSTDNTGDAAYTSKSGTSMASPNATGSMALLQQHYQATHSGSSMRAATLKALVIHTADEAGSNTGPDYSYGWGLLNTGRAAQTITDDGKQNVIDEQSITDGGSYTRSVTASGNAPLKVTVVWTDPAGTPVADALDPTDAMLVNDLDVRITKDASTYYAWKLDVANPANAATNSAENDIDNVEQVYIANPVSGSYTITVDHDGTLSGGSQAFSIIISGIDEYSAVPTSCSTNLVTPTDGATGVALATTIKWEEVFDATSYDLYFGTDGGGVTTPTNIENGTNQPTNTYGPSLQSNTTYYVQVVPRNNQGTASGCNTIWSFTTETATKVSSFPFTENFDGFSAIGTGNDWSNASDDDADWSVDANGTPSSPTGPDNDHTIGSGNYLYTEASSPNYPGKKFNLLTPLFDFSSLNNPHMEFWYNMFGADMGNLHIDVYANGVWNLDVLLLSGELSSSGTDWKVATIDLSSYTGGSTHQIRFRGITGDAWLSDMAIDDVVIRSEAFRTFISGSTESYTFANTDATINFTVANSAQLTLETIKTNSDPGTFGSLPGSVTIVSPDEYWTVNEVSGTTDGTYSMTLDLANMGGISDYSTLVLLKRANSSSTWAVTGTNNYIGSGTSVKWTGITTGFSEFGIGSTGDNTLPVELTAFSATMEKNTILLTWRTESEINNQGFIVYRQTGEEGDWLEISHFNDNEELQGQGTVSYSSDYEFVDSGVLENTLYKYKLADIDYEGKITFSNIIEIETGAFETESLIPEKFVLKNAYPNPFNPSVKIKFGLPVQTEVKVDIFDISGKKVKTLVNTNLDAGWHTMQWNGQNEQGQSVGSGLFIYRIRAGKIVKTQKLILLK
jgi:Subtilase family/MAM domain, meprin/A5/mu/FlgD Ig-like domain